MKKKSAEEIVEACYPWWNGPTDLTKVAYHSSHRIERDAEGVVTKTTWIEPFVAIPYPYERLDKAKWNVLYYESITPVVKPESVTGSIPAILREGRGVEVALQRIKQSYPSTICLENRGGTKNPRDALYGSNNGRRAIIKAVNHFGEREFDELCLNLWWGAFLKTLVQKEPSKAGMAECRKYCPSGGLTTVTVNGDTPDRSNFSGDYGPCEKTEEGLVYYVWTLEDMMSLLF